MPKLDHEREASIVDFVRSNIDSFPISEWNNRNLAKLAKDKFYTAGNQLEGIILKLNKIWVSLVSDRGGFK